MLVKLVAYTPCTVLKKLNRSNEMHVFLSFTTTFDTQMSKPFGYRLNCGSLDTHRLIQQAALFYDIHCNLVDICASYSMLFMSQAEHIVLL